MATTLIALGSNLGDRAGGIDGAIERLSGQPGVRLIAVAPTVETRPIGVPDSDAAFFNSAARFEVELSPQDWLEMLLETERELGRRRGVRWGARRIDLDLLLYDELIADSRPLKVPHPRMAFRRFVMQPAIAIAGDLRHPICDATLARLGEHLDQAANWVWWPAAANEVGAGPAAEVKILPQVDWRQLESGATAAEWHDAAIWLATGPIAGPGARVIVTRDWPAPSEILEATLPRYPKLAIRSVADADPFDRLWQEAGAELAGGELAVRPIRLQLPLESNDPAEMRRDIEAALEAMTTL